MFRGGGIVTTARRRFALRCFAACAIGAGIACGLAAADAGGSAYTVPGTGGPPLPHTQARPSPVIGRVVAVTLRDGKVIVTISVGRNSGVGADWTAQLLRGDSDDLLPGGDIKIVRVDKAITVGTIAVTVDELAANSRVRLSAP